jgi:hypothetical protein
VRGSWKLRDSVRVQQKRAGAQIAPALTLWDELLGGLLAFLQYEGDGKVDLVAGDVVVLDYYVLVLNPGTLDVTKSAGGTLTAILTASSKLWSEIALISVTRATVKRYSFLRLSLKDFLPLHFGFANASVVPVRILYLHIGLVIPLGLFPLRWYSLGTRPVPTWPTTCVYIHPHNILVQD